LLITFPLADHELAHSLVAKAYGLRVQAITLLTLGGVSQIEADVPDAKTDFWMAIAGPITSAVSAWPASEHTGCSVGCQERRQPIQ
jgi:Zn-dependent protease